nr:hypothetical protein [Nanoarchaeota archaeon]
MLLINKREEKKSGDSTPFGYTSKYITDELELVHDQQENIVRVSEELEQAFSQVEEMRKLLKIVKKIDKTIMQKDIMGRRKQGSRMINLIEDMKRMVQDQKYENIERFMLEVQHQSQMKIKLSQEELHELREMMSDLIELYKEAAGLCRLYRFIYDHVKQIYDKCEEELGTETTEEEELSKAGLYTEHVR